MNDLMTMLHGMRRPALLIRAARIGQGDYARRRDLGRILRTSPPPAAGAAVMALIEREGELNERRLAGNSGYTAAAHVEVLAALMAEARTFRARL
jgi:hypothetical protein